VTFNVLVILEHVETVTGALFTAEIGFKRIVFSFRKDGVEHERHTVNPEEIQGVNIEPNWSTRLAIRLHRDLVIPSSKDESTELQLALERILEETKAAELRRIEAAKETRTRMPNRMRAYASSEDYEKVPDD